jgi:hypothetical protein
MGAATSCGEIASACARLCAGANNADSGGGWARTMIPYSQALGPLLALVAIVAGWIWVSRDNNRRESRKELRVHLNEIRELIGHVEDAANSYFRKAPTDDESRSLSVKIKRDLQHLGGRLATLKACEKTFNFDAHLMAFRASITDGDFDSNARAVRSHTDRIFLEICNAANSLIEATEDAFARKYSSGS